ncbi:MAG: autotransporter domain-containing protein [Acidobacteriota bacterium]
MRRIVLMVFVLEALAPAYLFARPPMNRVAVAGLAPGQFLEGNAGVTPVTAFVRLPAPVNTPTNGTYQTVDGTALAADNDYQPASGDFTIPAGQTETSVTVNIRGDTKVESNETFSIAFTNVTNPPLIVTIVNDDVPVLAVADARRAEGNVGTSALTFTVTLAAPAGIVVQAGYTTADGTATAGADYQAASGTVAFAAGETQRSVVVNLIGDTAFEPDETFTLNVSGGGAAPVSATGTILNDDTQTPSGLRVESGNTQNGIIGRQLLEPLVVRVLDESGSPIQGVTVQWRVTRGSAILDPATAVTGSVGRAATNVTVESLGVIEVEASVAGLAPVTFTINAVTSLASRATGPVAVPIAQVLDNVCADARQAVFAVACAALGRLADKDVTPSLERVAPQQSGAQSKVASEVTSIVTAGIGARLSALRSGTQRFSLGQFSLRTKSGDIPVTLLAKAIFSAVQDPQSDAGGVPEDDYNGWSAYLSGDLGSGERRVSEGQTGFDLNTRGIMAGVDRQFGDAVFGASIHFMQLDSTLDDAVGSLDANGYALSVYGSRGGLLDGDTSAGTGTGTRYDGLHVDGSITVGRNNYEAEHTVAFGPLSFGPARSENDATVFALAAGTGIDAHHGRTDFDASLSGSWSRASIDEFSEEGSGPLILFVEGQDVESLVATAGLNVRSAFPVTFGVLLPSFRGEMIHEFKSGARLVTARFLRDFDGNSFTIPLDRPDANYARLAAGLQAVFPRGISAFVEVSQDVLRSDLRYRNIQFNVSKSF